MNIKLLFFSKRGAFVVVVFLKILFTSSIRISTSRSPFNGLSEIQFVLSVNLAIRTHVGS